MLFSCTKEEQSNTSNLSNYYENHYADASRYAGSVSVSSQGFLSFTSRDDYGIYMKYLDTAKLGEINFYLQKLGFLSIGQQTYDVNQANDTLADNEIQNYLFDSSGFLSIEKVIIKQMADTGFILTYTGSSIPSGVYQNMKNGVYDNTTMNKFAINVIRDSSFNLIDFAQTTKFGTTENTNPSTYYGAKRKFIGQVQTTVNSWISIPGTNNCQWYGHIQTTQYVFWINAGSNSTPDVFLGVFPCDTPYNQLPSP